MLPSAFNYEVIDEAAKNLTELDLDNNWTTFYMQVICTFVFVGFILHVTGKHTVGPDLGVYGVPAICFVLWALCSVDWFTGASFNPALAIGLTYYMNWKYPYNPSGIMTHYLPYYVCGAACGGILAGIFYLIHENLFKVDSDEDEEEHKNAAV